ncbi:VOC family protein [Paenibacillus kobensis]|uniref:VOC family protein n=1 Tax=Paenibacillus kobensis TaxID=59841 RepID=UPI0013E2AEC3|nr:VOC family protein [Paenibacillus kobensis]
MRKIALIILVVLIMTITACTTAAGSGTDEKVVNQYLNGKTILWQHVTDVNKAAVWYEENLGITRLDQIDGMIFLSINGDETELALIQSNEKSLPPYAVIDFQTDDIQKLYQHLQSKSVKVDPLTNPGGPYWEFHFYDPDGNKMKMHGYANA